VLFIMIFKKIFCIPQYGNSSLDNDSIFRMNF